jgi:hypothetical protein
MMNPSEMAHKIIEQWNDNPNDIMYSRAEMDPSSSSSATNPTAAAYLKGDYSAEVLKRIQELSHRNLGKGPLSRFEEARRTVILDVRCDRVVPLLLLYSA